MNSTTAIIDPDIDKFPTDSWVRVSIGTRLYIGRAFCRERAQLVSTVDDAGRSVTFSWPYICANAATVDLIPD